jgi:prepilin-type N-terminal cleavage/methylation domain-containing protein
MRTLPRWRRGFSLIEILVALVILGILGASMTKLMLSQTRGYQYDAGGRRARTTARSAMNIMTTDLRMTQDNGGVSYVDATDHRRVDVKVPVAFGVVCKVSGSSVYIALAPVDSFQLATIRYAGYAVRNSSGTYDYVTGDELRSADASKCHDASVAVYADTITMNGRSGKIVEATGVASPPAGTARGSMAFVWQTVGYFFASSQIYTGRWGLYRAVTGAHTRDTMELMSPFSSNARFSYYTNPAQTNDAPRTTAPADLNTIRGFQIFLPAEASDTVPGRSGPQKTQLTTAVFFKNTRIQ